MNRLMNHETIYSRPNTKHGPRDLTRDIKPRQSHFTKKHRQHQAYEKQLHYHSSRILYIDTSDPCTKSIPPIQEKHRHTSPGGSDGLAQYSPSTCAMNILAAWICVCKRVCRVESDEFGQSDGGLMDGRMNQRDCTTTTFIF